MAGLLDQHGFMLVDEPESANVWVLNSCTVKNPSEDLLKNWIKKGKESGVPVVVAGCVPQGGPDAKFFSGVSLLGTNQIDRIVEVVEQTLQGNLVRLVTKSRQPESGARPPLDLPKIRRNEFIEIIAISTGCLNQCTYCKTKHARGELGSYSIEEIVDRARHSFDEGVVELWITSEDTGAYGRDIGTDLPTLLKQVIKVVPKHAMLRLGMTNPPYIMEHMQEMTRILNHPNVYSFIHIPVQSGSNEVLGEMKREYSVEDFCSLVDFLKREVPGINIATDIICGFPTETEEDFSKTLDLIKKYKFNSLFTNQYYPRPGTVASRMPQIATSIAKRRTGTIAQFFKSYFPYNGRVGEVENILITEIASDKKHLVGHNKFYEQVLVECDRRFMGKWMMVEIVNVGKFHMKGVPHLKNSVVTSVMSNACGTVRRLARDPRSVVWFAPVILVILYAYVKSQR